MEAGKTTEAVAPGGLITLDDLQTHRLEAISAPAAVPARTRLEERT